MKELCGVTRSPLDLGQPDPDHEGDRGRGRRPRRPGGSGGGRPRPVWPGRACSATSWKPCIPTTTSAAVHTCTVPTRAQTAASRWPRRFSARATRTPASATSRTATERHLPLKALCRRGTTAPRAMVQATTRTISVSRNHSASSRVSGRSSCGFPARSDIGSLRPGPRSAQPIRAMRSRSMVRSLQRGLTSLSPRHSVTIHSSERTRHEQTSPAP